MRPSGSRIMARCCAALVLLAVFLCAPCLSEAAKKPSSEERLVAIDVGHSEPRPGATSARGRPEYRFNRDFAIVLADALKEQGIRSFFLDSRKKKRDPEQRSKLADRDGASIMISIHHDSAQPRYLAPWEYNGKKLRYCDKFHGYSLFYSSLGRKPTPSLNLAKSIGQRLIKAGFMPTPHHAEPIKGENREFVDPQRGVYRFDHLRILKSAVMPAVLLECGVILHRTEELLCMNPRRMKRMADAVAQGIVDFMGGR